ncbi:hypothetical protein A9K97_gp047 [Tokyovirus A1]|uniref:hypothetical protein n=1 Tax=Tokyovirus A1 TaxID=1826170 RepID=UPI0007A987ED|nr:hypothetical protein A9K97_gp047 [Tokyovirus A1]BAU80304.1 hypothetical protein [Tokyovirus A1]
MSLHENSEKLWPEFKDLSDTFSLQQSISNWNFGEESLWKDEPKDYRDSSVLFRTLGEQKTGGLHAKSISRE